MEIKSWIKALKNSDNTYDYSIIAKRWLHIRAQRRDLKLNFPVYIIPSPSRSLNSKDHALGLATALMNETGWEIVNILEFATNNLNEQKLLKKRERNNREFVLKNINKETLEKIHSGTVIFVDDVITTGSTALAAWKCLKKPINIEVWTMAHQEKNSGSFR